MPSAVIYLLVFFASILHICIIKADTPSKGDRGDVVTSDSISSTGSRDLIREATGYERPAYGSPVFYPPSGNNKGWSQTSNPGYQRPPQGNQKGYPTYGVNTGYGSYGNQRTYVPQNTGSYVANQPGYGNNKGWSSTNTGWGGNYGRPSMPSYGGNYKGSSGVNQGWYGGQSDYGGQTGYGGGWNAGNQIRPASGGYNWPQSTGYRGEKGYSGSYGGNWGYGNQGGGYGGGYVSQGTNKGLGNQIYGSGYGGQYSGASNPGYGGQYAGASNPGYGGQYAGASQPGYSGQYTGASHSGYGGQYTGASQKGWSNPNYGNTIPVQGGWGLNAWDNYGNQGYNKGGSSPRMNTAESKGYADTRSGYVNYPNNKAWW